MLRSCILDKRKYHLLSKRVSSSRYFSKFMRPGQNISALKETEYVAEHTTNSGLRKNWMYQMVEKYRVIGQQWRPYSSIFESKKVPKGKFTVPIL